MDAPFEVRRMNRAASIVDVDFEGGPFGIQLVYDAHWDHPKCKRDLLRRHLDKAVEQGCGILFGGDTFCLMQSKRDKRHSKGAVRQEHMQDDYFSCLLDDAISWFEPYRDHIIGVGYGNHETAIIKHAEIDLIKLFCRGLGIDRVGGYGGYLIINARTNNRQRCRYTIKYYHGSGGGGAVNKGAIGQQRRQVMYPDADAVITGHVHESTEAEFVTEHVNPLTGRVTTRSVLHIQVPTYKEEYGDGTGGWHVERGAAPKPVGGKMLWLNLRSGQEDSSTTYKIRPQVERLWD